MTSFAINNFVNSITSIAIVTATGVGSGLALRAALQAETSTEAIVSWAAVTVSEAIALASVSSWIEKGSQPVEKYFSSVKCDFPKSFMELMRLATAITLFIPLHVNTSVETTANRLGMIVLGALSAAFISALNNKDSKNTYFASVKRDFSENFTRIRTIFIYSIFYFICIDWIGHINGKYIKTIPHRLGAIALGILPAAFISALNNKDSKNTYFASVKREFSENFTKIREIFICSIFFIIFIDMLEYRMSNFIEFIAKHPGLFMLGTLALAPTVLASDLRSNFIRKA